MDRVRYRDLFRREALRLLDEGESLLGVPGPEAARARLRILHTLKGMGATMASPAMVAVAHAAESLAEAVGGGRVAQSDEVDTLLAEAVDRLRQQVHALHAGIEPPADDAYDARVSELIRTGGTFAFQLLRTVDDEPEVPSFRTGTREMAGAQAAIAEIFSAARRMRRDAALTAHPELDRIDAAARQLYDQLVGLRLVSFASLIPTLRRHVRTVATRHGKRVTLTITGEDVETDEALLGRLTGPISALCANAVVHGIEDAEGRRLAQKPPHGRLSVAAERVGATLVVRVEDDGAGFDTVALARGGAAAGTLPAVSTRAQPDTDAGRGVGLDAVRHAVDALAGSLFVESRAGRGSRVKLVIPVLADLAALWVVEIGGFLLGVRATAVEGLASGPAPGLLGLSPEGPTTLRLADGRLVGVDRVVEEAELLVSAPPFPINRLAWVRGTSVAPDGRILLVVDP